MSEREALYRAVCERPDDDLPRLVFADWLDEHGEHNRAAFIRAQCELEQLPPASPEAARLMAVHYELLKRTDWEDVDRLPAGCWPGEAPSRFLGLSDQYRRGFLWRAQIDGLRTFQFAAADLFGAVPVGAVTLGDLTPTDLAAAAASRELARLTGLGVRWSVFRQMPRRPEQAADGFAALGKSPFAARLTELALGPGEWSNRGLDGLTDTPLLARLRRLRVASAAFSAPVMAGADCLTDLAVDTDLPGDAALFILDTLAGRLEHLTLRRFRNTSGSRAPSYAGPFPRLAWLDLSGNPLTEADVGRLIGADTFPELRAVELRECWLDTDALDRLLAAPFARRLTVLDVRGHRLTAAGVDRLCRADLPDLGWVGVDPGRLGEGPMGQLRERFGDRLVTSAS
jgi:uncharacterized protein (TIGR02996 family)